MVGVLCPWFRKLLLHFPEAFRSPPAPSSPVMQSRAVSIAAAGVGSVVGSYVERAPISIPHGFAKVCEQMRWSPSETWLKLSSQSRPWFEAPNGAYIYYNVQDGQWWIDEPNGGGVYVALADTDLPPSSGWKALPQGLAPLPQLSVQSSA